MKTLRSIKVWVNDIQECTPMHYVTSQWQKGRKNSLFFLFRLISFIWFIEALILSFIQVRYTPEYWPIYYTHWSFLLATIQSGIALVLVSMNQADAFKPTGGRIQNRTCLVYEYLFVAAATQAFSVTVLFWAFVYKPEKGWPTFQTIQVHALNSVMMLMDLFIVAFPVRAITIILPFLISLAYLFFNLFYFLAGGKTSTGKTYIYHVLDWNKPKEASLLSTMVAVLVIIIFCMIWFLSLMRRVINSKMGLSKKLDMSQSTQTIMISTIA